MAAANTAASAALVGRRILDFFITAFWLFLVVDAWVQGRELPLLLSELDLPELHAATLVGLALVVAAGAGLFTYRQRHRIMDDMPLVSRAVDRWFGEGAYRYFSRRLRPVWASIVSSLVLGSVGLYATSRAGESGWSYAVSIGFLGLAVALFVAWLFSRRYPPALR